MSARKLGRFAGLVFVLAVVFGGLGATSVDHAHAAPAASVASATPMTTNLSIDWD